MAEYRLLGPVEVEAGGRLLNVGDQRRRAVLAVLLHSAGQVVSAEALIDRVWGEDPPEKARATVQTHLTRIRRSLREAAECDGEAAQLARHSGGYRLEVPSDQVDLHRFRRLVGDSREPGLTPGARARLLREALDCWNGEPLTGIRGDWASRSRTAWQRERLEAVGAWADAEVQAGNAAVVLTPLGEDTAEHPEIESLTAGLMRALVAVGRHTDALVVGDQHRRRLAEEYGTDQSPEIRSLYETILRGETSPPVDTVGQVRRARSARDAVLDRAVDGLARAQLAQWRTERAARGLGDPYPLPVRWAVTPRTEATMASWPAILGVPGGKPVRLDGEFSQIADVFTGPDSPQRLAIVGGPGAGKSMLALQLTLDLLERRSVGDPVPVLLPMAEWDPTQTLDAWVATRLATDHRALARRMDGVDGTPGVLADDLVAESRVLPVLDGLDEIDTDRRAEAIAAIGVSVAMGRHLVLTCRIDEYEEAVAGGRLTGTPVVELLPLDPKVVAAYLADAAEEPSRWGTVVDFLQRPDTRGTALARAVSTPLVAWLARAVYRGADTDPAELLTSDWARSSDGIERRLLGQLVPAAYAAASRRRTRRAPGWGGRAGDVQRRFGVLASWLHVSGTRDLAWWRVCGLRARIALWAGFGLVLGFVFGVKFGCQDGCRFALAYAVVFGLAAAEASLSRPHVPAPERTPWRATARRLRYGIGFACAFGGSFGLIASHEGGVWLWTRLVLTLALPVSVGLGMAFGLTLADATEGGCERSSWRWTFVRWVRWVLASGVAAAAIVLAALRPVRITTTYADLPVVPAALPIFLAVAAVVNYLLGLRRNGWRARRGRVALGLALGLAVIVPHWLHPRGPETVYVVALTVALVGMTGGSGGRVGQHPAPRRFALALAAGIEAGSVGSAAIVYPVVLGVLLLCHATGYPQRLRWRPTLRRLLYSTVLGTLLGLAYAMVVLDVRELARWEGAIGAGSGMLAGFLVGGCTRDLDDFPVRSPRALLVADRAFGLVVGVVAVAMLLPATGYLIGSGLPIGSPGVALAAVAAFGLGYGFLVCEWGPFCVVRVAWAMRGRAPLRFMAFLDESHRRGVLRRAGGVYQFRHARLQDHLADWHRAGVGGEER